MRGGRGDFIVTLVRGDHKAVLWDKRRMGDEFPDEDDLLEALLAEPA